MTASVPNPTWDDAIGHAFLLRGQGTIFSPGFGRLCTQLRERGWWAEDLRCIGDLWACRHLRNGRAGKPIVFIGHSAGGRYSIAAARRLARLGIPVDLIVCIDVALPPPIPSNVKRAIHIFKSGPRIYPARPLRPARDADVRIDNIDLHAAGSPIDPRGVHHLNITGRPAVQSLVLRELDGVALPR